MMTHWYASRSFDIHPCFAWRYETPTCLSLSCSWELWLSSNITNNRVVQHFQCSRAACLHDSAQLTATLTHAWAMHNPPWPEAQAAATLKKKTRVPFDPKTPATPRIKPAIQTLEFFEQNQVDIKVRSPPYSRWGSSRSRPRDQWPISRRSGSSA